LLGFQRERAVSDDFFRHYWFEEPKTPYKLSAIPGFSSDYKNHDKIRSIDQFFYGMYRIFIDGLLFRGNVRSYFRELSMTSSDSVLSASRDSLFSTEAIKTRGPTLPLSQISKDDRYLISEMACKSYGPVPQSTSDLKTALLKGWDIHEKSGGGQILVKKLLDAGGHEESKQSMFHFSADDILDTVVDNRRHVEDMYERIAEKFTVARDSALENTKLYLSMVNDLDVYVATSMRKRSDFRGMADRCEAIFGDARIQDLHLRYFDPTMSAADGHQDKGLIECLMVKCAKVLIYCAGEKESYGKDAEAAMALSLGKPVIFLCEEAVKKDFYREVHPLSRLINFQTGVAVGAMVTSTPSDVPELLDRLFENEMEYELVQPPDKEGYLQLMERLTKSVVRLQTNNELLSEIFWNYYMSQR